MWKASLLYLALVLASMTMHAESLEKQESNKPSKDLDKGGEDTQVSSDEANDNPGQDEQESFPQKFESVPRYHLSSAAEQKRGQQFGFVGSRGRRVETPAEAMFGADFPVRRPVGGNTRLRMLLEGHHQDALAKEKRKPHFGFHGARG